LASSSLAQEPTPIIESGRAYQDYLYNVNLYRQTHDAYVVAKESYLNYQTLNSQAEAFNKTLLMLQQRDEVIRTYLFVLRLKLLELTGIKNYLQSQLFLKLETEFTWYKKHAEILPSAGNLEDLIDSSKQAQDRYKSTLILIYQTLGTIPIGQSADLSEKINSTLKLTNNFIEKIRSDQLKDTTKMERWLIEAGNRLARANEKIKESQDNLSNIASFQTDILPNYQASRQKIVEAHQYLKEANYNLHELVQEIKNAE
jgi:hypothetical protein